MKTKSVYFLLLIMILSSSGQAVTWTTWWTASANGNWGDSVNWKNSAAPTSSTAGYTYKDYTITVPQSTTANTFAFKMVSNSVLDVLGTLNVTSTADYFDVGGSLTSYTTGTATLKVRGSGYLDMMNADNSAGAILEVGNVNNGTFIMQDSAVADLWSLKIGLTSGITGTVLLDGGTINTNYLLMNKAGAANNLATMDVTGGTINIYRSAASEALLDADKAIMQAYVDSSWIYTSTAGNHINVNYNKWFDVDAQLWKGTTTMTSVPEPVTIAILGLGGLLTLARRRK